jgi:hypothetical protein
MNIIKFVKDLLPTTERNAVRSSLVNATQEFNRFNKPQFKEAGHNFGSLQFKSPWALAFEKDLEKVTTVKSRGNAIALLDAINTSIEPLFGDLANLLDEYFSEDFSNESITIQRYNILQFIEAIMLYVEYSRRWLIVTLRKENNLTAKAVNGENDGILPYDLTYLAENRDAFLKVVKIISGKIKDLPKMIEDLPEYTVSSTQGAGSIARNQRDIDPFGFGFISTRMNPIFYLRMQRAKVQVAKLQAAELEAQELEFRILALRASLDGKPDAKKEALANALEDKQLNPLREKIAKWTEEYTNV